MPSFRLSAALAGWLALSSVTFAIGHVTNYCPSQPDSPGPVFSLKAVAVNGAPVFPANEIQVSRGDVITVDIQLSGWGGLYPLLDAYQITIDVPRSAASGSFGLVLPLGWNMPVPLTPCAESSDCVAEFPGTYCHAGMNCVGPNPNPSMGVFLNGSRPDFVFVGVEAIYDVNLLFASYFGVRILEGVVDQGGSYYAGTLVLQVGDDACGEFTYDVIPPKYGDWTVIAGMHFVARCRPAIAPLHILVPECDCNENGVSDLEEIADGVLQDCDGNEIPDECETDCDGNGREDACDLAECTGDPACSDCNANGVPDQCDIACGNSADTDHNGRPDECFVPIPTVSAWGLAAIALLLLISAKLTFRRNAMLASRSIRALAAFVLIGTLSPLAQAGPISCPASPHPEGAVFSLEAVAVNGVPVSPTNCIHANRGDIINAELRISGWGTVIPLLRAYEARIDSPGASVISGDFGQVLRLGWDASLLPLNCSSNADCSPDFPHCFPQYGHCSGPTHNPQAGVFIDQSRADFIFADVNTIAGVNSGIAIYFGVMWEIDGVPDLGGSYYAGSLILEVGNDACGEFTYSLVPSIDGEDSPCPPTCNGSRITFFSGPDFNNRVYFPALASLSILVPECDCNENGVSDLEEIGDGVLQDCDGNEVPDECESDCNGNDRADACDLAECDGDPACGDCNANGILDECDIAGGESLDQDDDGRPDECFVPIPTASSWGLLAIVLLLMIAAKLAFRRDVTGAI